MSKYKIIEEWSRPRYIEPETGKVVDEDYEETKQAYWVAEINKEGMAENLIQRFDERDEAEAFQATLGRRE